MFSIHHRGLRARSVGPNAAKIDGEIPGTKGARAEHMRLLASGLTLAIGLTLATACAPPPDASAGSSQAGGLTEGEKASAEEYFHPQNGCWVGMNKGGSSFSQYDPEIDLSDREHPKYRIRHPHEAADEVIGKQNINIFLRDGSEWRSDDNLISRRASWKMVMNNDNEWDEEASLRAYNESKERDPWEPLPVPKEFLDKAFEIKNGRYNLLAWEAVLNDKWLPDQSCRQNFYYLTAAEAEFQP